MTGPRLTTAATIQYPDAKLATAIPAWQRMTTRAQLTAVRLASGRPA